MSSSSTMKPANWTVRLLIMAALIGVVSLTVILADMVFEFDEPSEVELMQQRCEELELGMTRYDVLAIMGTPIRVSRVPRNAIVEEYWYYDDKVLLSTPLRCEFDSSTGIMFAFQCNDNLSQRVRRPRSAVRSDSLTD